MAGNNLDLRCHIRGSRWGRYQWVLYCAHCSHYTSQKKKERIDWIHLAFFPPHYWQKKTAPNWHQYYRSPGWKTAYLHWRPSCRCQPGSAGWTSWSGDGVFAAECTSPCPSDQPSADRSRSGCRWLALGDAHTGGRLSVKGLHLLFYSFPFIWPSTLVRGCCHQELGSQVTIHGCKNLHQF